MLALPPGCSTDNLPGLADWLEASVLLFAEPVAKAEIMEEIRSAGLVLPLADSFGEDSDEFDLIDGEDSLEALERLVEDIFAECRRRSLELPDSYPFSLAPDLIALQDARDIDCYAFLLIADFGHNFPELRNSLVPDTHSGKLMEKVVEAAAVGLFGRSQRFGWPREDNWPTSIEERIVRFAKEIRISADNLENKLEPADKDRTLDVAAVMMLGDSHEAGLIVLIQCAAGQDWKGKLGTPSIAAWDNLLHWKAHIMRAIALPWRLGGRKNDWTYGRVFSLSNGAMVLDRPRLLRGNPDFYLDTSARKPVSDWWRSAINSIPQSHFLT